MNGFLNWLFGAIAKHFTQDVKGNEIILWCPLPFFGKFVGDGILLLWDTRSVHPIDIGNIVASLGNICDDYLSQFLPAAKQAFTKPPSKLRCGIARGQIISVGDGNDFVGSCINLASRLQKLGQFSFAFSRRGFDLDKHFVKGAKPFFTLVRVPIRGIGEEELVYVFKKEFRLLTAAERKQISP